MVYKWKEGYRAAVPAQVAGERLAEIGRANGDLLTPAAVVDDARPEGSPLHPCFNWDDAAAAELYREEQARGVIRNNYYEIDLVDEQPAHRVALQYVHVEDPEDGPGYVDTRRAVADPDLYAQVEAEAVKAFQALRRRYEHIKGLARVFAEIDRLADPGDDRKARKKRA